MATDLRDESDSSGGAGHAQSVSTEFWNLHPCGGDGRFARQLQIRLQVADSWILDVLTPAMMEGRLVLDLACGQGFDMTLVARSARFVVGADLAMRGLRRAQAVFSELGVKNAMLVAADAESLPFNACFERVYCIGGLNHTVHPARAVEQIYKALKPGGVAIVMVYRRWTPIAAVVVFARLLSNAIDRLTNEANWIARRLEGYYSHHPAPAHGTALLELFGCPILKTYTKREVKTLFSKFSTPRLCTYRSGFDQVIRFLPRFCQSPGSISLHRCFNFLDRLARKFFGFYLVVECCKPASEA